MQIAAHLYRKDFLNNYKQCMMENGSLAPCKMADKHLGLFQRLWRVFRFVEHQEMGPVYLPKACRVADIFSL